MAEDRPEKATIRGMWSERVALAVESARVGCPLYLTLCGAEGRDIGSLVDAGVIRVTETGAIHEDDFDKVVGVESNTAAAMAVRQRFPGLRVLHIDTRSLLSGTGPFSWPSGEHRSLCKAHVVNFDFNGRLNGEIDGGHLSFPALREIAKLAQIHAEAPQDPWTLCLTFRAEVGWEEDVLAAVQKLLVDNFSRVEAFAKAAKEYLGSQLLQRIREGSLVLEKMSTTDQQLLLMALVPKKVVQDCQNQGWKIETLRNLSYGGRQGQVAMVSWIFRFVWDPAATTTPDAVYRATLSTAFDGAAFIEEDGSLS